MIMLKALIKKQFLELNTFYFQNRKTGKRRSKSGTVGMTILYIFVFITVALMFSAFSYMLAGPLISMGYGWLYYSIFGLLSVFLGVFGAVFNTYAGLYHAKDNELLLSMPVPPSNILLARMTGVYAMGLLYESLVMVPSVIIYWINAEITPLNVILPILLIFIIGFFVMSLTCALGWVVALISSKLKNKSFITVIVSLIFFALYYMFYYRLNSLLQSVIKNADVIGEKVHSVLYPFYLMGLAAEGKALPMLGFTAITAGLTALTCFILSRTFIKIVTAKTAEKKAVYKENSVKTANLSSALLRKELKHFTSSPTYMLNGGLGLIILPVLAVAAVIKSDWIIENLQPLFNGIPGIDEFLPIGVTALICLILSMNAISAPSVSLEGKNLWILQSLPVKPSEVLMAKQKLHIILNAPVAAVSSIIFGIALKADVTVISFMTVFTVAFTMLSASFGLILNLLKPNLTWTNETVPIKQSFSVAVTMFSGWGISAIFGVAGFFLYERIGASYFILFAAVVLILATRYMNGWLKSKGAEIFAAL